MKGVAIFLVLASIASTFATVENGIDEENNTAYGYLARFGVPWAQEVRKAEREAPVSRHTRSIRRFGQPFMKIIDGSAADLGTMPYQAGLIGYLIDSEAICGGSLISSKRVVTAAHCWWDGEDQAKMFTVVLGSTKLFSGGIRLHTTEVIVHEKWNPDGLRNDIAIVYLPKEVEFTKYIKPIALPSERDIKESFVGQKVYASGYGRTRSGNTKNLLNYVKLEIISNKRCNKYYSDTIAPAEMCAEGDDYKSICNGDSGGPLALMKNNKPVLIGITSFVQSKGDCKNGAPGGFTRVTAFTGWIKKHLKA